MCALVAKRPHRFSFQSIQNNNTHIAPCIWMPEHVLYRLGKYFVIYLPFSAFHIFYVRVLLYRSMPYYGLLHFRRNRNIELEWSRLKNVKASPPPESFAMQNDIPNHINCLFVEYICGVSMNGKWRERDRGPNNPTHEINLNVLPWTYLLPLAVVLALPNQMPSSVASLTTADAVRWHDWAIEIDHMN